MVDTDEANAACDSSEACFFMPPASTGSSSVDTRPESRLLFTCGIRPQHRGKPFLRVYDEDPHFVRWVLDFSDDEIFSDNLKLFINYCRKEAEWQE